MRQLLAPSDRGTAVSTCRLLSDDDHSPLLHYFRRTKSRVEQQGPLPTSRQSARAQQRRQQEVEQQRRQEQQRQLKGSRRQEQASADSLDLELLPQSGCT